MGMGDKSVRLDTYLCYDLYFQILTTYPHHLPLDELRGRKIAPNMAQL
jgi:hypothetical protein